MPSSTFLAASFSFMKRSCSTTAFCFFSGSFLALLGVNGLEHFGHQLYFGARRHGEHIPIEMNRAALVFGFRKHFSHGLQHPQALVANDQLYAIQTAATLPLEEAYPASLILFHALSSAKNLTVSVFIHRNRQQNSQIFKFFSLIAARFTAGLRGMIRKSTPPYGGVLYPCGAWAN